MHGVSDSDGSDTFEWDSDGLDGEDAGASSSALALRNIEAPGPSTRVAYGNEEAGPSASSVQSYVDMGFPEEMVRKAIKDNGDNGADQLVQLLLTYQEIANDPSVNNGSASGCVPQVAEDSDDDDILENWDDDSAGERNRALTFDESGDEGWP